MDRGGDGASSGLIKRREVVRSGPSRDAQYVHAWLINGHGDPISSSAVYFGGSHHVSDELAPGQVLSLPVSFSPDAHLTTVGVYEVEAVMPALDLWFARSTIVVRQPPVRQSPDWPARNQRHLREAAS